MALGEKKVQAYVSEQLYASIEAYAKHHRISVSKAVADLLVQGMVNFIPSENSQPLQPHTPSFQSIDITQFVTRDEFEARMSSLLQALGSFKNDVQFAESIMSSAASFVERQSVEILMANEGLTKSQAIAKISQIKHHTSLKNTGS